jgi:pyruvate/2-oxoglutarate dehydrogenase complex dihydrolipoamide acyltransferase (E2) component
MKREPGHRVVPFTTSRRLVAATAATAREQNTVHALFEVDVTEPRRFLREHRERTGEVLSFTAFLVACLARAVADNPHLNALRRGRRVYLLDDVTIGVLIERTVGQETVPELLPIRGAQDKTYRQIHNEIRAAQQRAGDRRGGPSRTNRLARFLPDVLLRAAVRVAIHSVAKAKESGVVTISSVGMYGRGPGWGVPLSVWTVAVTTGGIARRPALRDGEADTRELLCLTISFDHDLVDGGPAVRFMRRFAELLRTGEVLRSGLAAGEG